ncbi:tubulin-like doman-containing protein [Haloplanus salilacus]|uniref:tubulin-like doman-containing protein n=1 Tax=Haloplanus salilacus TaxID=2949994 RepID=UPI0030D00949
MSRYRTPDHLVCLGEGGTEVGKTFMRQRWILEEVLRDDPRDEAPDEDARPLYAYFIDSDKSTLSTDIEDEIEETVDSIEEEYGLQNAPDVEGSVINVVEGPHKKHLQSERVTARTDISELALDQNIKAWWLQQGGDSDVLDPLSGLERGGVDRMRGLTKAIYRISQWKGDPLSEVEQSVRNDTHDEPHVAIVVGLGGGTGSGLFLDLAHRIKQAGATVTLFGVLPNPSGGDDNSVRANAYAALSELEYLALSGLNLFEARVLLPYDPAIRDDTFDKAAVYTINAFYNVSGDQTNTYSQVDETDDTDGPPDYAPFTIGTTRYLHYLKEDIEQTKDNFEGFTDDKKAALDAEESLYDELRSYLEENHGDEVVKQLRTTDDSSTMRLPSGEALDLWNRLDELKDLLDESLMKELEFKSASELSEAFEDIKSVSEDEAEWEDDSDREAAVARDFVGRLADNIGTPAEYQQDGEWAADERDFVELVVREVELVARRAGIIKAREAIDDEDDIDDVSVAATDSDPVDDVTTDIDTAIAEDNQGYAVNVDGLIDDLDDEKSDLTTEIDALEAITEAGRDAVGELAEEWETEAEDAVEQYYSLFSTKSEIEDLLSELETKIDRETNLEDANNPENIIINGTGFDDYGTLTNLLDDADCDDVDEEMIEGAVKDVKRAKQKRLKAEEYRGSIKEAVLSFAGYGRIGGLQSDYEGLRTTELPGELIRLSKWNEEFEASVQGQYFQERTNSLDDREDDQFDDIKDAAESVLADAKAKGATPSEFLDDDLDDDVRDRATSILDDFDFDDVGADPSSVSGNLDSEAENADTGEALVGALRDGAVSDLLRSVLVTTFQRRKEEREGELETLESTIDAYETLSNIVSDLGGTFHSNATDVDSVDSIVTFEEGGTEGPFKVDTEPYSRGQLSGTDDLSDAPLWTGDERAAIVESLTDILPQVESEHLPINKADIRDGDTERVEYEGHRIGSAFMSPLFDGYVDGQEAAIPEVKEEIVDNRRFTEEGYHNIVGRGAFADSFDFAMSTFLRGVFLDNLRIFTTECRDAYTSTTDVEGGDDRHNPQDEVPGIVKRHSYGLDGLTYLDDDFLPDESDGGFCYRRDVLNFNRNGTEVLLNQTHEEVVATLLEDYHEVVGYPSTIEFLDEEDLPR